MRALCLAVIAACSSHTATPLASGTAKAAPAACASIELVLASEAAQPGHPCRDWIEATRGRVFGTGVAFSGTIVATTAARGGGVFLTCGHCTGAGDHALGDPESKPPAVLHVGTSQQFYLAYRIFEPVPPRSAFDDQGHPTHILPRDDIAVAAVSNKLYKLRGQLDVLPPASVKDGAIALEDPRGIAVSADPFAPALQPGAQVLLLGYPRDLPDKQFHGELVASVGAVVDDATARDRLSRAEPDEASVPYDPEVELVIATRAVSGMSGGGAFDAAGRFVGVMVRGTTQQVDGQYLTRVVRASFIRAQLRGALDHADATLRDRVAPFLPSQL